MRIGKLRHSITIDKYSPTVDTATNETVDTYQLASDEYGTPLTFWAEIRPLTGRELLNAQEIVDDVSHQITMRYTSDVDREDQILFDGHTYDISAVLNPDMRNISLVILANEVF